MLIGNDQEKLELSRRLGQRNSSISVVKHKFLMFICFLNLQPYLKPGDGPIVLVLAPTRELAVQIKEECDKFGASSQIKNTVVYGGVKKHTQVRALSSGVEILIATPGRLIDHLEQGNTNLKRVTYLVLDEAGKWLQLLSSSSSTIDQELAASVVHTDVPSDYIE